MTTTGKKKRIAEMNAETQAQTVYPVVDALAHFWRNPASPAPVALKVFGCRVMTRTCFLLRLQLILGEILP